jgi:hypothetical protein
VSEREVIACIAEQFGYEVIDPTSASPSATSLDALPARFAFENNVLPLGISDTAFRCAICDPIDINLTDSIEQLTKRQVEIVLAEKELLSIAIRKAYAAIGIEILSIAPLANAMPQERKKSKRRKGEERWDREALLALAAQIPVMEPKKGWFGRRAS